jgi:hypothetical protein
MASKDTQPWSPVGRHASRANETVPDRIVADEAGQGTDSGDGSLMNAAVREVTTGEHDADLLLQALHRGAIGARTEPGSDAGVLVRASSSDGAPYAAHHGVHAVPRRAAPEIEPSGIILNVTVPLGIGGGAHRVSAPVAAAPQIARAVPASVAASPEQEARHAKTIIVPRRSTAKQSADRSAAATGKRAIGKLAAAAISLVVVLVVGGAIAWRLSSSRADAPNSPAAPPAMRGVAAASPAVPVSAEASPASILPLPIAPAPILPASATPSRVATSVASPAPTSPARKPALRAAPAAAPAPRPLATGVAAVASARTAAPPPEPPNPSPSRTPLRPIQEKFE